VSTIGPVVVFLVGLAIGTWLGVRFARENKRINQLLAEDQPTHDARP
jgi:hypothetical protein